MKTGTTITLKTLSIIVLLLFAFTFVMSFFVYYGKSEMRFHLPNLAGLSIEIVLFLCGLMFFTYVFKLSRKIKANKIIAFSFLFSAIEYTTMPSMMEYTLYGSEELFLWDFFNPYLDVNCIFFIILFLLIAAFFAYKDKHLCSKATASVIIVGISMIIAVSIIRVLSVAGHHVNNLQYIVLVVKHLQWIPLCIAALILFFSKAKRGKKVGEESFDEVYDELYEKGWLTKEEYDKKIQEIIIKQ